MGTCLSKKHSLNEESSAPAAAAPSAAVPPSGSASRKPINTSDSDAKAVKRTSSRAAATVGEKVAVRKSNARETEKPSKPTTPTTPLADISNLKADNEDKPAKPKVEDAVPPARANGSDDNGSGCPTKQSIDDAAPLKKGGDGVVRTSSCTKEEVDAILIQCGRLSRSSSGKSSNENNARALTGSASTKRHCGSKRHFEYQGENENHLDRDAGDDGRGNQRSGRSSHKRTPSGDMGGMVDYYYKRSSSKERNPDEQRVRRGGAAAAAAGGEARRRVSRSPGRRGDATPDKSRSTRSGRYAPPSSADTGGKPVAKKNNVASRSRSPAARASAATTPTVPTPSLSRNSSRKGEQSPYRRPLVGDSVPKSQGQAENSADPVATATAGATTITTIASDRNKSCSSGNHQNIGMDKEGEREEKVRNPSATHRRSESLDGSGNARDRSSNTTVPHIREQLLTCRVVKQMSRQQPPASIAISDHRRPEPEVERAEVEEDAQVTAESLTLDAESCYPQKKFTRSTLESAYPASALDNDVRSPAFYLPPCVSKACSILEAVADLNSNSTVPRARDPLELLDLHNGSNVDDHHVAERHLHRYVSARRDVPHQPATSEGQESSGSNTIVTTSSAWEPTSADSTDRWVDGPLFQKFMVREDEENSSSSSAYRFKSLPAGVREDALENLKAASTTGPSSEQDKRAAGRYDASGRVTSIAAGRAHTPQKFVPVITLSNSIKKEAFHNDGNVKALTQSHL